MESYFAWPPCGYLIMIWLLQDINQIALQTKIRVMSGYTLHVHLLATRGISGFLLWKLCLKTLEITGLMHGL